MIIKFKDPNRRIHGKLHKCDPFYFRYHYGEQRLVYISKPYIDRPTERQKTSREAFTALRKEVARQLHDPILKARWEARFKRDKEGYKMLHTYVYAKLKAGETVMQSSTSRDALQARLSPKATGRDETVARLPQKACLPISHEESNQSHAPFRGLGGFIIHNHTITPLFLPWKIPKQDHFANCKKNTTFAGTNIEQ